MESDLDKQLQVLEELLVQAQHTQALITKARTKDLSLERRQCEIQPARKRPRSTVGILRVIPQGRATTWSASRSQRTTGADSPDINPLAIAKAFDAVRVRQPNVCIKARLAPPTVQERLQEKPEVELQSRAAAAASTSSLPYNKHALQIVCRKCDQKCWYACRCECHTECSETVLVPDLDETVNNGDSESVDDIMLQGPPIIEAIAFSTMDYSLCCDPLDDTALDSECGAQLHCGRDKTSGGNQECTQCDKKCWFGCTCECHHQLAITVTGEQGAVNYSISNSNNADVSAYSNDVLQQQQQHQTETGDSKMQQQTKAKQQRSNAATFITHNLNAAYRFTSEYTQNGGFSFGSSRRGICSNDCTRSNLSKYSNGGDDANIKYRKCNSVIKGGYMSSTPRFPVKHAAHDGTDDHTTDKSKSTLSYSDTVLSAHIRPSTVKIYDAGRTKPRPRLMSDKVLDVPGVGSYELMNVKSIGTVAMNASAFAVKKILLTAKAAQLIAAQQAVDSNRAPGTHSTDKAIRQLRKRTDIGNVTMRAQPKQQALRTGKHEVAEMKREQARIDKEEERKMAGLPRKDISQDHMQELQQGFLAIEARVPTVHIAPQHTAVTTHVKKLAHSTDYYDVSNAVVAIEARCDVKGALFAAQAAARQREGKRLEGKPKVIIAQKFKKRSTIIKDFLDCQLPQAWVSNNNSIAVKRTKGVYRYTKQTNATPALRAKQTQEQLEKANADVGITHEQWTIAINSGFEHQAPRFDDAGRDEIRIDKKGQQHIIKFTDPILNVNDEHLSYNVVGNDYNTIVKSSKAKAPIRFDKTIGRYDAVGPNGTKSEAAQQGELDDNDGCADGDHLELAPNFATGKKRSRDVKLAATSITRLQHVRPSLYDNQDEGLILDVTEAVNAVKPRCDTTAVNMARAQDRFDAETKATAHEAIDGDNLIIYKQVTTDMTKVKGHKFSMEPRFPVSIEDTGHAVSLQTEPNFEVTRARAIPQYTIDMHRQRDRFSNHVECNEHDESELQASALAVDIERSEAIVRALKAHTRICDSAGHIDISKQLSPRDKVKPLEAWQDTIYNVKLNTLSTHAPVRQPVQWSKQLTTERHVGVLKNVQHNDAGELKQVEGDILELSPNHSVGKKGIKQSVHWSKL
jgi:hypothetical protein